MGALRKACKDIDFGMALSHTDQLVDETDPVHSFTVFMDAPHVLTPVDLTETFGTESDLDAVGASETSEDDPAMAPRGWWHPKSDRAQASMETSILAIRDLLVKDHYEGIFGFRYFSPAYLIDSFC